MRVFSVHGFHGGSVQAIAAAAKISPATLLHHFPSKKHLLESVLELKNDRTSKAESVLLGQHAPPMREAIKPVCESYESTPELRTLYCILASEAIHPQHPAHPHFKERFNVSRNVLERALERERQAGRLRPYVDIPATAANLMATWYGLQLQRAYTPDIDVVQHFMHAVDQVLLPEED
ncbi:TetR/AcrR family transcriptional regulator [Falsarthrobacter nasiphocae]